MSNIKNIANSFIEACETGKGWEVCKNFCVEDASFSSHAEALLDVKTIKGYSDWMTWSGPPGVIQLSVASDVQLVY